MYVYIYIYIYIYYIYIYVCTGLDIYIYIYVILSQLLRRHSNPTVLRSYATWMAEMPLNKALTIKVLRYLDGREALK